MFLLEEGALPPKFSKFCPIYLILYHLNMLVKEKATNNECNELFLNLQTFEHGVFGSFGYFLSQL